MSDYNPGGVIGDGDPIPVYISVAECILDRYGRCRRTSPAHLRTAHRDREERP